MFPPQQINDCGTIDFIARLNSLRESQKCPHQTNIHIPNPQNIQSPPQYQLLHNQPSPMGQAFHCQTNNLMIHKPNPPSRSTPKTTLHLRRRFRKLLRILYEYHKERADARKRAAASTGKGKRKSRWVEEDDVDDASMYGGYTPLIRENLMGGWR